MWSEILIPLEVSGVVLDYIILRSLTFLLLHTHTHTHTHTQKGSIKMLWSVWPPQSTASEMKTRSKEHLCCHTVTQKLEFSETRLPRKNNSVICLGRCSRLVFVHRQNQQRKKSDDVINQGETTGCFLHFVGLGKKFESEEIIDFMPNQTK